MGVSEDVKRKFDKLREKKNAYRREVYRKMRLRIPKKQGAQRRGSKLNDSEAMAIFNEIGTHRAIAKKYKISRQTVFKIKHKLFWKHIHGQQ